MTPLKLIASAAYLDQELAAEFGRIPPAFLPIGVSCLYEKQIALLGSGPIYLTLPESFSPQKFDLRRLEELNVIIIRIPDGLLLGDSIIYALNTIDTTSKSVCILHGDTLIDDASSMSSSDDCIAVFHGGDDYSWAVSNVVDGKVESIEAIEARHQQSGNQLVVCGYFVFQDRKLLIRALTRARGDFIQGLNSYCREAVVHALNMNHWRDFGHIQTYFRSRREILTARAFNELTIQGAIVEKTSLDRNKMRSEFSWFSKIPPAIKPYTARVLDFTDNTNKTSYVTEYQYAPTLAELLVFSSIGRPTWNNIFRSCHDFLSQCSNFRLKNDGHSTLASLASIKTIERLEKFSELTQFPIKKQMKFNNKHLPSLLNIASRITGYIDTTSKKDEVIMHGDFCFSNILYNSRSARITVIDPRGYVEPGKATIYGDSRYDLAKFFHSIEGRYDHILAGRYHLTGSGTLDMSIEFERGAHDEWLESLMRDFKVDGIAIQSPEIRALTVGLFLSMLPLHSDRPDRQQAFIANALRLFVSLEDA
jgi:hypothetical protein